MEAGEVWRPVAGYEDRYQVSDKGRVRKACHSRGPNFLKAAKYKGQECVSLMHPTEGRRHRVPVAEIMRASKSGNEVPSAQYLDPKRTYKKTAYYHVSAERKDDLFRQIRVWHLFGLRYTEIAEKIGVPAHLVAKWAREDLGLDKPTYRKPRKSRAKAPKPQVPDLPNELWRDVPGYEGLYSVSTYGRVKTKKGLCKSRDLNGKGYAWLSLFKDGKSRYWSAHALILEAFVGPRPKGQIARHLDGTRRNHLDNLAWGTYSENARDYIEHSTIRARVSELW